MSGQSLDSYSLQALAKIQQLSWAESVFALSVFALCSSLGWLAGLGPRGAP